jgi:hypothetical protein
MATILATGGAAAAVTAAIPADCLSAISTGLIGATVYSRQALSPPLCILNLIYCDCAQQALCREWRQLQSATQAGPAVGAEENTQYKGAANWVNLASASFAWASAYSALLARQPAQGHTRAGSCLWQQEGLRA